MRIAGTAELQAPPDRVWAALNDPAVLVRTIPGCTELEPTGPDTYRMTVTAGVASIRGVYQGEVALSDQSPPASFRLRASGAGAPGTVSADVLVRLEPAQDGATRLDYEADAVVGGMVGGVGQRMLVGVAKRTAGEFFRAVDGVLTGAAAGVTVPAPRAETALPAGAASPPGPGFAPPPAPPASREFARGAVLGAAVALLGALVGGLLARRR